MFSRYELDADRHAAAARSGYAAPVGDGGCNAWEGLSYSGNPWFGVPSCYIYDTNMDPVTLHDYCSYSPDTFVNISFKGPCSLHDFAWNRGR